MRNMVRALVAAALLATPATGQTMRPTLDHATAARMRDACLAWAAARKLAVAVAIFNEEGRLIVFAHMDGAAAMTGDVAQWKGRSAATIHAASAETANWAKGPPGLATWEGGTPFFMGAAALGGIGVSGAESAEDTACGLAAIEAAGLSPTRQ